jgi:hypothetical protein
MKKYWENEQGIDGCYFVVLFQLSFSLFFAANHRRTNTSHV